MNSQSNPLIASLAGRSCDVLVIGGGVAGVCAAVAAARSGADTMLVERIGFLGGAATAAAVNQWMGWKTEAGKQIIAGLGQEMIDRLIARGGSNGFDWGILSTGLRIDRVVFDPEILKVVLDDMLTDERSKAPDALLIESDDLERIFHRLDRLGEREAMVIRMRFGLEPYVPMTLREVGENLGLTRERVRQLESQALVKLMTSLSETGGQVGH